MPLHIYLEDVYGGYFSTHLSLSRMHSQFTRTVILKMYLLPISYTPMLKMCAVGISLHIYVS